MPLDIEWSDDEKDGMDVQQALDSTLGFGQWATRQLSVIMATQRGRDYLRYILQWDELKPGKRAAIEAVLAFYNEEKTKARSD